MCELSLLSWSFLLCFGSFEGELCVFLCFELRPSADIQNEKKSGNSSISSSEEASQVTATDIYSFGTFVDGIGHRSHAFRICFSLAQSARCSFIRCCFCCCHCFQFHLCLEEVRFCFSNVKRRPFEHRESTVVYQKPVLFIENRFRWTLRHADITASCATGL